MAFMVIGLHANFLDSLSPLGNFLTVQGFFRIAVPIFLVINGFYFFSSVSKNNYFDWLKKITGLYVVWMAIYSYFWFSIPDFSLIELVRLFIKIIIGYHHLWYISGMLGAAIILLLLRKLPSLILCLTIALTFSIGVFIQYSGNYHLYPNTIVDKIFNLNYSHRNALFFSYPFFCIGYLINKHSLHKLLSLKAVITLTLLGSLLLVGESYANYLFSSKDVGFDNYSSLILFCPVVFILFMNINISGSNKNIALYSSAVYFIHSLFLSILNELTDFNGTISTFIVIFVSLVASYFIIKLNRKVKFIL
jgi:hypothetical protein